MNKNLFQYIMVINDIHLLYDNSKRFPLTSNYIILVTQGNADIIYNKTNYHLTKQMLLFGYFTNPLEIVNTSPDWQCVIIIDTKPQVNEVIYSCLQIEKDWHKKVLFIHSNPVLSISYEALGNIQQLFNALITYNDSDNIYHQRIKYLLCQAIIFEIFAWIDDQIKERPQKLPIDSSTDRKQQLLLEFMRLLQENKGKERNVGWYAEQMCITTKYLQSICRNTVQTTPTDIIDKAAVAEIKALLSNTNKSIKEVAGEMHFSSASSFCKYFHRLTGMSALSYRKQR